MKRFKEFLTEAFLIEGKIDDLKAQNPGLHHEIDQYAAADTSATKKFLPWLVSQHKKGNVSPDHPDLHQTIQNFDRYRNTHGIKDHSSRSFQEVRDAVVPLVGGPSTKKGIAEAGREKIHDSGDVQVYHIKSKFGSQHFYGGGPDAGPTGTSWCVSARSPRCMFGRYGEMYTIHAKGDPDSPYAVHPEHNKITNRHNDGDRDIDQEVDENPRVAKLKPALAVIQRHHDPVLFRLKNAGDISNKEIDDVMNNHGPRRKALVTNPNSHIVLAALHHPNVDATMIGLAAQHPDSHVALTALNHPKADRWTPEDAVGHPDPKVALAAVNHPNANHETLVKAFQHKDANVALAALNHPHTDEFLLAHGVNHPDPRVVLATLNHPRVSQSDLWDAAQHENPQVALAAINHPKVTTRVTKIGVCHSNPTVALAALNHPKADWDTIFTAADHPDPNVALAAVNHPEADRHTLRLGLEHDDPRVQDAAMAKMNK